MLGDEVLQVLGHLDVPESDSLGQRRLFPSGQGVGIRKQFVSFRFKRTWTTNLSLGSGLTLAM